MPQCTSVLPVLQPNRPGSLPDFPTRARVTGLYVHVPFCVHKCGYCDFYSVTGRLDRQRAWLDAVLGEFDARRAALDLRPATIFVGGGTPTLLDRPLWVELLAALRDRLDLSELAEFTVEANPETVTPELLATLRAGGVDRVSIGCQSFQPDLLATLERSHNPASVRAAVDAARAAGIGQVSLDLIYAVPGQTLAQLDADLDALLALTPDHLSCYSLIFEPGTALTAKRDLGRIAPADNDLEAAMFARVIDRLADAGYEHYEVSNWAQPGRACRHNLGYWTNANWLGLGPAAASHVDGLRWKNLPKLERYLDRPGDPPVTDIERLDPDASVGEALMLGLRLRAGVALDWLDAHLPADSERRRTIDRYVDAGLMQRDDQRLSLTPRGLMVADTLLAELL